MIHDDVVPLTPRGPLVGSFRPPGDKSVGHRVLLLASVATGTSVVRGLPGGGDVASTRGAVDRLGTAVRDRADGAVEIEGRGWEPLERPPDARPVDLECGNSGTTARLLAGLLAGRPGVFVLRGDASLSRRPMDRVAIPLARLGARIEGGPALPLTVRGGPLRGASVETGVASAQVKSALLLAAVQARGPSAIVEPRPTRDHTERLLAAMGAPPTRDGPRCLVEGGRPTLRPLDLEVPADPSSAAFAVALACLVEGSAVEARGVLLSPRRLGFYRLLARMGAEVRWSETDAAIEPTGTIVAKAGPLRAIDVAPEEVADAIDELPLLAVAATRAEGTTVIRGAAELRLKESDRIRATVEMLRAFGARAEELPDGLRVTGPTPLSGTAVDARGDHRIAMCAAVAASIAKGPSRLSGGSWIAISYPEFFRDLDDLERAGADGRGPFGTMPLR